MESYNRDNDNVWDYINKLVEQHFSYWKDYVSAILNAPLYSY